MYSDEVDEALTPSHLLMGRRLISRNINVPDEIHQETEKSLGNRVKYLNTLIEHYDKRWKKEYITELREYQKNKNKIPAQQIKVGDVVLIEEEGLPRARWRLGKVHELFKSKDGYVRGCRLKVFSEKRRVSFLNRPINKLCYFEVSSVEDQNI